MSNSISFFTPVEYDNPEKTWSQSLSETVDNYFYLGGKKAFVLHNQSEQGQKEACLIKASCALFATVAKVLSYITIVLPVLMLIAKIKLRSSHTFRVIDVQTELERGIDLDGETIYKVRNFINSLKSKEQQVQHKSEFEPLIEGRYKVLKLNSKNLVFKFSQSSNYRDERFCNMIKAKEVCLTNRLGLLYIPHAKKIDVSIEGKKYSLIVEEYLKTEDMSSSEYSNEQFRQLAIFITKTGFYDVAKRNIPIMSEGEDFKGNKRVALVDLEHMFADPENRSDFQTYVESGFVGSLFNGSGGLIRCASNAEQANLVSSYI